MGLTGWHALIILGILLIPAVIIVVIVLVVRSAAKRGAESAMATPRELPLSPSGRLAQLDQLKSAGQVSDAEYDAKRAQILSDL